LTNGSVPADLRRNVSKIYSVVDPAICFSATLAATSRRGYRF
jgi:hypothetical protein